MPRRARKKSQTGIYHVMLKGINRQPIFEEEEDREKFISVLRHYKQECGYAIFAYCLMDNHVHFVIREGREPLAQIMKRIGVSYVYWYNVKYKRSGHLFQDRYKSDAIEDDKYLLEVIRYIHQKPLQAEFTTAMEDYRWNSYAEYTGNCPGVTDTSSILEMFDQNSEQARQKFIEYMSKISGSNFFSDSTYRLSDEEGQEIAKTILEPAAISQLATMEKEQRNELLKKLKNNERLSIRQIARLTGLTFNVVAKA